MFPNRGDEMAESKANPSADPQQERMPISEGQPDDLPPAIRAFVEALARVQEERDYHDLVKRKAGLQGDRKS